MGSHATYLEEVASGRYSHIIGADECGLGSWAGPLMVCAAAAPIKWELEGLRDSKKLSRKRREELFPKIHSWLEYVPILTPSTELDRAGIKAALLYSFWRCVTALLMHYPTALVVLDGEVVLPEVQHLNFPKADNLVPAVMAAAVMGKVTRDRWMTEIHKEYPMYSLNENFGYGTPAHLAALKKHGPCPLHRVSYEPIRSMLKENRS